MEGRRNSTWKIWTLLFLQQKPQKQVALLEDYGQIRKLYFSGMETIGLLNLHNKAEMVQKHGREMPAVLSICFQEPPVFNIKKKSLYSKFGSRAGRF